MELTNEEYKRYSRHLLMPEMGEKGQKKLKAASVLVIGCGGLGSPVLLYLAAVGIGKIGLVEFDTVDETNLQRQILFSEEAVGKTKIDEAEKRLKSLNRFIEIKKFPERLTSENALDIFRNFDVIVDGSDNFPTRYLVNDACEISGKPFVYGAIHRFEGQVSVFNFKGGVTYRDLFPEPPAPEMAPNCATAGVLGMMAGIVGSLQATETIKILTGIGEVLSGKLLVIDALSSSFRKIALKKIPGRFPVTELIDYESFCLGERIPGISYDQLLGLGAEVVQLIDVREPEEYALANLGGELMPLSKLDNFVPKIRREGVVVVHCQSGIRSKRAIELLKERFGFDNLLNLEGGMPAITR